MKVLNLVTSFDPFFEDQVRILERKGVTVETLSVPGESPRSLIDYQRFVPSVLRESLESYDVIHANYGLTAPFALAVPQDPVVLSLWGSDLLGRYRWLSTRCARLCDETVVMSEEMARELPVGARVVPHGVDLERFRPSDRAAARAAVGWDPDAHHVLFPYSPDRDVKNFPRAERVVERARRTLDAPVLLHTVHGLSHDAVPRYMNAADALLFTSRREGSPNVVKEAMACNLPVVATDVGDVAERLRGVSPSAVRDDDAALAEALVGVLRSGRRSNGREVVADLSLDRMGDRLLDVYRAALDRPTAATAAPEVANR